MLIREANANDSEELKNIQGQCPAGTKLIVNTVNEPDFFARAKAYENVKVFIAYEQKKIAGSIACAFRNAVINDQAVRIGYIFQLFISPEFRRRGIAKRLFEQAEQYLENQQAKLIYTLVIEDNEPSMRLHQKLEYNLLKVLSTPYLATYKEMKLQSGGKQVRLMTENDLEQVCCLFNRMWLGYDFYEPLTVEKLTADLVRIPEFSFNSFVVVEEEARIVACAAYWDWSKITKITIKSLSFNLKMTSIFLDVARLFVKVPRVVKPGNTLKQWCLANFAFVDQSDFLLLLKYINNLAVRAGVEQVCFICDKQHQAIAELKGFIRINVDSQLYLKILDNHLSLDNSKVWVNGVDM